MRNCTTTGLVLGAMVLGATLSGAAGEFVSLFDGKTLDGWHKAPAGVWEVEDGVIVGTTPVKDRRHAMLLSDKQYDDFVLRLEFKIVKGDSGAYFRAAEQLDHPMPVNGFQADIGAFTGRLYETNRKWLVEPPSGLRGRYKPREWNEMVITAKGRDITVQVNGVTTAEVNNDPGRLKGHFGFQMHGGSDTRVEFKDIEVQVLK